MYIGMLVVTLAACPCVFQLDWLSQSCITAVCVWSCFITSSCLQCRKILNSGMLSNFVWISTTATETFASLTEVYGDATVSRTTVFKWHNAFKEARENVDDDPCSGRPISSTTDQNVEVVRAVMTKDRRMSVRMIADETGLDKNAVHRILTDHLHMQKICAKLVPKNLSVEQKANRLEICQDLLGRLEIVPDFFG